MVNVGKIAVIVSMFLGTLLALWVGDALMGEGKQGFQYIQEYTGFVSPGIFAMFILGFFWKKTTSNAALFATIGGFIFSVILKFSPQLMDLSFLSSINFAVPNAEGVYEIPFMDRMSIVFLLCVVGMYIISVIENKTKPVTTGLEIDAAMFKTNRTFTVGALLVIVIVTALYTIYW